MSSYAISDIHGCVLTFRKLVIEKIQLKKEDALYLLGDMIDRGPDSKGVLDFIFELKDAGFTVICIRGNHEQMLLNAPMSPTFFKEFMVNGGKETLKSFEVKNPNLIPAKYIHFLNNLDFYQETDNAFLVHAGFNFEDGKPLEDKRAMMWIRDMKIDSSMINNKHIIHGHTPQPIDKIIKSIEQKEQAINIDNGCKWVERELMGNLVALEINSFEYFVQENAEEV